MQHAQTWNGASPRSVGAGDRRFAGLWLAGIAIGWWVVTLRQFADAGFGEALAGANGGSSVVPMAVLSGASVGGRALGIALEALFYAAWWRSWGHAFRYRRFFTSIAAISLVDAWALTLRLIARGPAVDHAAWFAPFAGLDLLRDGPPAGGTAFQIAFGSFGLAVLVRIALTARAQARELGTGMFTPAMLTTVAWLASRIVSWWSIDLARGASPLP